MTETDNGIYTGLVLEGCGLRGVFTCGVLNCFMDHGYNVHNIPKKTL